MSSVVMANVLTLLFSEDVLHLIDLNIVFYPILVTIISTLIFCIFIRKYKNWKYLQLDPVMEKIDMQDVQISHGTIYNSIISKSLGSDSGISQDSVLSDDQKLLYNLEVGDPLYTSTPNLERKDKSIVLGTADQCKPEIDSLNSNLERISKLETPSITISITNLRLMSKNKNYKSAKYFITHLQCNSQLFSTSIVKGKLATGVNFEETFSFVHTEDGYINILVYSVEEEVKSFKLFGRRKAVFKSWGRGKIQLHDEEGIVLEGTKTINIGENGEALTVMFDIHVKVEGFLDICKCSKIICNYPCWNLRWCSLTKGLLRTWSSPIDQQFNNGPRNDWDLTQMIMNNNIDFGMGQRYFFVMEDCDKHGGIYFISTKNKKNVLFWKKYFEVMTFTNI